MRFWSICEGEVEHISGVWPSFLTIELVCSILHGVRLHPMGGELLYYKVNYPVFAPQPFDNLKGKSTLGRVKNSYQCLQGTGGWDH